MKIDGGTPLPLRPKQEAQVTADGRDARLLKATQMYEQQFLREMVRAMRTTVPESDFVQVNMAEKIFRGQLDDEYVDQWTAKGGIGFADMVYDNITERMGMPKHALQKPKGPMPLHEKRDFRIEQLPSSPGTMKMKIESKSQEAAGKAGQASASEIQAPWRGRVSSKQETQNGTLVVLDHENGLRSRMFFEGVSGLRSGQTVVAGARVGSLNPGTDSVHWMLEPRVSV